MKESHPPNRAIISVIVSPKFIGDWDRFQRALNVLTQQDQGIRTATEPTERRVIIGGMSESHLEVACDRLLREFKIPLDVGKPEIVYLETIRKSSEAEGKYIRQVGGRGQYAHVKINLEPAESGSGYQFIDKSSNAVPRQFVESIDSGIQEAMKGGVLNGKEIVDIRVVLCDGSYHVEDSSEMAFELAACMALKEAARKANPVILEPFMSMDVFTPEDYAGSILKDLSSRRGRIERVDSSDDSVVIQAVAPLRELLGYPLHLRVITQGRGSTSMQFASYGPLSKNDGSGADEIGVPANKPRDPTPRSGFAAAEPNDLFD